MEPRDAVQLHKSAPVSVSKEDSELPAATYRALPLSAGPPPVAPFTTAPHSSDPTGVTA